MPLPSRTRRTARALRPRPTISEAARPTASTRAPFSSVAITAGSLTTTPSPLTYTRMVEVPRSMPIFFESTADSIPDDPGEIVPNVARLAVDAGDVRAQAFELAHDFLIATVEVIDVVEHGRPPGAESSNHERRAGADVGHRDRPAMQLAGTGDDRAAALHNDVRPQFAKFWHMMEAVFEYGLRDMAPPVSLRHQADKGRLQIRRESGVRPGRHVHRLQVAVALYPEAVRPVLHLDARRPQLEHHGSKVGGLDVFEHALPTGRRDRKRIGSRLDVVGEGVLEDVET